MLGNDLRCESEELLIVIKVQFASICKLDLSDTLLHININDLC